MLNKLRSLLLGDAHVAPPPPGIRPLARNDVTVVSAPVYPPVDAGLPASSVDDLLATQATLIGRIRQASAMTPDEIALYISPVIRNFADYIHLLPASREHNHRGAGGLFRLGLELAFYSLQASDGVIYAGLESTERKRVVEQRWRYAAFIAAIMMDIHRAFTRIVVTDAAGAVWPAYTHPLGQWLRDGGRSKYHVSWVPPNEIVGSELATNSLVLGRILPEHCSQYLREGGPKVLPTMLSVLSGAVVPGEVCTLNALVAEMRRKVLERDGGVQPDLYGRLTVGAHIEPYVLDAMRRLVRNETWKVNQERSRIWYGDDGMFIVWKTAAREIMEMLAADKVAGVPQDSETLCEMLVRSQIVEADASGNPYRTIVSPLTEKDIAAVKIANPYALFADHDGLPEPLRKHLEKRSAPREAPPFVEAQVSPATVAPVSTGGQATPPPASLPAIPAGGVEVKEKSFRPSSFGNAPPKGGVTAYGMAASPPPPAEVGPGASDLLLRVDETTREVLLAIIQDYQQRKFPDAIYYSKELGTVVVEMSQMNEYGVPRDAVVRVLKTEGWLFCQPETPEKLIHHVSRNNQKIHVFAFDHKFAKALGLAKEKP